MAIRKPSTRPARTPRIGCSGWNYRSWRGRFYPRELPVSRWLVHYAGAFDTVEINNTFYRLPEASTFERWRRETPTGFLFAVKASRFLTHIKRLRDPEEPLHRLFERAAALGPRLGPVLYQLPGSFHQDLTRLETFLQALPQRLGPRTRRLQHVLEFRHPSWYDAATYRLLDRYGVALCAHDKAGAAIDTVAVGPFVYVRFHGTSGHYHGSYADRTLDAWAERLAREWAAGRDVYAYFNNDPDAVATADARRLSKRVARYGTG